MHIEFKTSHAIIWSTQGWTSSDVRQATTRAFQALPVEEQRRVFAAINAQVTSYEVLGINGERHRMCDREAFLDGIPVFVHSDGYISRHVRGGDWLRGRSQQWEAAWVARLYQEMRQPEIVSPRKQRVSI